MSGHSIIRDKEYDLVARQSIDGRILDVGGSTRSGYHELLSGKHSWVTLNINPFYGCDIICDVEKPFPIKDEEFDAAVCLNVLEHIYEFDHVVSEIARTLRPEGTLLLSTPFLFHVHGSPDDYFRYTQSALGRLLRKHGFNDFVITEIGDGLFSLLYQTVGGSIPTHFLRMVFKRLSCGVDAFLCRYERYRQFARRIPLGYFVVAKKMEKGI